MSPFFTFNDYHSSASRGCVTQLGKLKYTAFVQKHGKVNWNQSVFSENVTDIADNLKQFKDAVLKQDRNIKFKILLKVKLQKNI